MSRAALSPTALSVADAARVLSRVGGAEVTESMIEADLGDGAPANDDGTINLVHYAAWLVRRAAEDAKGGPFSGGGGGGAGGD